MRPHDTMARDHIWCVIPVYNNKDTVKDVALGCRSHLEHVVVVDDGSTDADVSALLADADVIVLRHQENRGKGQALLTGLRHVEARGGQFMITIDADGQHCPRDIEKFVPLLQGDDGLLVIGCRDFGSQTVPRGSRFGRRFANFWLRVEAGVSVRDCQSGFRAYPVRHLSKLSPHGSHYDFESEVLARAAWAGLRLETLDVGVWYPEAGERVTSFRLFRDNLRISLMHTRLVGRRLVPVPHRKLVTEPRDAAPSLWRHPVQLLRFLLKENASPGGLAAAAAVGMFLAVLPLVSVHTLVILYVATRLHLNKVMALNIQHLCFPPFVPVACIELGHYLRHGRWLTDVSLEVIFGQLADRLWEWLLGSLILAPLAAVLVGVVVFVAASAARKRTVSYAKG